MFRRRSARQRHSPLTSASIWIQETVVFGAALLERKSLFLRNLTSKMLGYALGRGLTLRDSCIVDNIVLDIERNDYKAQSMVNAIVFSAPFRYQEAAVDHR